jgi:hypothetical protein
MKNSIHKIWALALATFLAPKIWADPASAPEPTPIFAPDTALLLPVTPKVKLEWILPPADGSMPLERWKSSAFLVDDQGACWLNWDDVLANPAKKFAFEGDQPIDDFAFLDNGDLLISSDGRIGSFQKPEKFEKSPKGLPLLRFQALLNLPVSTAYLSAAGSAGVYLWGHNPKTLKNEVYLLNTQSKKIEVLFVSDEAIGGVAGNGEQTFVAMGKLVVKITDRKNKPKKVERVFLDPSENIRSLCFSRHVGLFCATDSGITYVNEKKKTHLLLIRTPNAQMDLKRDSLYVRLSETEGVFRVQGVKMLRDLVL